MEDTTLISVSPNDILTFNLEKGSSPRVVFTITNTSSHKVAFKVKTTQPTWYFVKPNQAVLAEGQTEEIAVALADNECSRILDRAEATGEVESLDKHRFLVLSRAVEEDQYATITALEKAAVAAASSSDSAASSVTAQRQAELVKLWQSPDHTAPSGDAKRSKKLKVAYVYPNKASQGRGKGKGQSSSSSNSSTASNAGSTQAEDGSVAHKSRKPHEDTEAAGSSGGGKPPRSVSENMDKLRNELNSSTGAGAGSSSSGAGGWDVNDLSILRSKYDTIVEYTVHLTAERDMIATQLDVLKREYNSEMQQQKQQGGGSSGGKGSPRGGPSGGSGVGASKKDDGKLQQEQAKSTGFSLMVLLLVAVLTFFLGRYS